MGMGFALTRLPQVSPLLHKTTLTTGRDRLDACIKSEVKLLEHLI